MAARHAQVEDLIADSATPRDVAAVLQRLAGLPALRSTAKETEGLKVRLPSPSGLSQQLGIVWNAAFLVRCHLQRMQASGVCQGARVERMIPYMQDICSRLVAIAAKGDSRAPDGAVGRALALLARMLFLENSRPIHRQLLSGLQRLPPVYFGLFQDAVLRQVRCHHASDW